MKSTRTTGTIHLCPTPWNDEHCIACGQDPRLITDERGDYLGWVERWAIDAKGRLCLSCVEESVGYSVTRIRNAQGEGIVWP